MLTNREVRNDQTPAPSRFRLEKLEDRVLFSHLAHTVLLPSAAVNGSQGITTALGAAAGTPGSHTKCILILISS